jgi:hypothetical protein
MQWCLVSFIEILAQESPGIVEAGKCHIGTTRKGSRVSLCSTTDF